LALSVRTSHIYQAKVRVDIHPMHTNDDTHA